MSGITSICVKIDITWEEEYYLKKFLGREWCIRIYLLDSVLFFDYPLYNALLVSSY